MTNNPLRLASFLVALLTLGLASNATAADNAPCKILTDALQSPPAPPALPTNAHLGKIVLAGGLLGGVGCDPSVPPVPPVPEVPTISPLDPDLPQLDDPDCSSFSAAAGQMAAQGLAQVPSTTADQILEASRTVATSMMAVCVAGIPVEVPGDGGGDDEELGCAAHTGQGVASVVCLFRCPFTPTSVNYKVMTKAVDPDSPTVQPAVYGAVGCFAGMTPVPPIGVSCAGQGYCEGEFAEGVKWLYGSCVHLAAGNNPQIIDRTCKH
jgi:hypothetical protein